MQVSAVDFIEKPALYLDKAQDEIIFIVRDGNVIAVLTNSDYAPITDSLLGILKNSDIASKDDIKAAKVER
jgi:hypothetical protein